MGRRRDLGLRNGLRFVDEDSLEEEEEVRTYVGIKQSVGRSNGKSLSSCFSWEDSGESTRLLLGSLKSVSVIGEERSSMRWWKDAMVAFV